MNKDTKVVVYGIPDVAYGGYDFKKECTLEESVNIIKNRWAAMNEDDKKLYIFSVLEAATDALMYEFYLDEFVVPKRLQGEFMSKLFC